MVMENDPLILIIELQIEGGKGIIGIINSSRNGNIACTLL